MYQIERPDMIARLVPQLEHQHFDEVFIFENALETY